MSGAGASAVILPQASARWPVVKFTSTPELLNQSREEALARLKEHAKALGANAVIGVAFDSSETGGVMTEVLAYGTAVVVEPETTAASPVRLG